MRLLLVGDLNSIHFIKWVQALHDKNIEIGIFSLASLEHEHYTRLKNLTVQSLSLNNKIFRTGEGSLQKIAYLNALPQLKAFIKSFQPDILHAHYASSYGLLGALCKFKPFVLSVWGSDVYDFPRKNIVFKKIVQFNLKKADLILSTSHVMATETKKYTNKDIHVTPFGVDLQVFKKLETTKPKSDRLVVGTVKALEQKYGIDTLIKAFAIASDAFEGSLQLEIVGVGGILEEMKALCSTLGIEKKVHFLGRIDNTLISRKLNEFDVYLALSRWDSESFGVAIVEAQACEIPVIVSNKGGLPEVVANNESGLVVPANNPQAAAQAMLQLINNKEVRSKMGETGRKRVEKLYDWNKNVDLMYSIYKDLLTRLKKPKSNNKTES